MKIYTITLNPVYDRHFYADSFVTDKQNYAKSVLVEAGGKGVNVSRALCSFGKENSALLVLGKNNCSEFEEKLQGVINYIPVYTDSEIRENLIIHAKDSETRLCYDKTVVPQDILEKVNERITDAENSIIVFSGKVPSGVDKQDVIKFLSSLKKRGAKLFVDSNSFSLSDLEMIRPFFIKPNEEELCAFAKKEKLTLEESEKSVKYLSANVADCVLLTMGKDGALFSDGTQLYKAHIPSITPLSTVGAGDSSVAGFIYAYSQNFSLCECVKYAVSSGTAACLTFGTQPPKAEDFERIYSGTKVCLLATFV